MFRHVVMFRLIPGTTPEQRASLSAALADLLRQIPEVRSFHVGADAGLSEGNFDVVVVAEFDDAEGYRAYAGHPAHVRVVTDQIRPLTIERAAVQFASPEVPAS